MKKLLGINVTEEEFDTLICEQNNGKELKIVDGKIIAENHISTKEEEIQNEKQKILKWFEEYDNQIKQYERCQRLGIEFDKDIEELDREAQTKQLRLREIKEEE